MFDCDCLTDKLIDRRPGAVRFSSELLWLSQWLTKMTGAAFNCAGREWLAVWHQNDKGLHFTQHFFQPFIITSYQAKKTWRLLTWTNTNKLSWKRRRQCQRSARRRDRRRQRQCWLLSKASMSKPKPWRRSQLCIWPEFDETRMSTSGLTTNVCAEKENTLEMMENIL